MVGGKKKEGESLLCISFFLSFFSFGGEKKRKDAGCCYLYQAGWLAIKGFFSFFRLFPPPLCSWKQYFYYYHYLLLLLRAVVAVVWWGSSSSSSK